MYDDKLCIKTSYIELMVLVLDDPWFRLRYNISEDKLLISKIRNDLRLLHKKKNMFRKPIT